MRRTLVTLAGLMVGGLLGAGLALGLSPSPETRTVVGEVPVTSVFCPTEDSCVAEYRGDLNRWVISPVVP